MRPSRFVAPAALAVLLAVIVLVVATIPGRSGPRRAVAPAHVTNSRRPPYWIVHPGDTLTRIAAKAGVTVAQLEEFNPQTDPMSLVPGQRLNLWLHPPAPRPKPPGPRFWTVRPGESFGLIAAKTGISLVRLEALNPQLKPTTLQPGQRVSLRR